MTPRPAKPTLGERILRRVMPVKKAAALVGDLDEEVTTRTSQGVSRWRTNSWRALQIASLWWAAWRINRERATTECAGSAPVRWLDGTQRDVRHGLRSLRRRPTLALTAVLTLGLAVGAATAVYGVLDAVVLRAVPGPNAARLVSVSYTLPPPNLIGSSLNHDGVDDAAERTSVFERVGAWKPKPIKATATVNGEPADLLGAEVSTSFLPLFAVAPELGRWFLAEEAEPGRSHVVILSDSLWRSAFSGDPSAIGRSLIVDGDPYEVVGVMPDGFDFPRAAVRFWVPDTATADERVSMQHDHIAIGLLRPGVTMASARASLATMLTRMGQDRGLQLRFSIDLLRDQLVGRAGRVLVLLFAAVGFVLAVACGNVSILLLISHSARARETAIRLSLGAGRGELVRLALVESMLLGLAGAMLGSALAVLAVQAVHAFGPATIPRLLLTRVNIGVLAFAIAVSIAASVLAGLLPAVRSLRLNLETSLGDGLFVAPGGGSLASRHRGQALLVLGQLVLVTVLVVGSCLLLRSLVKLLTVDVGFNPDRLMAVEAALPEPPTSTTPHAVITDPAARHAAIGQAVAARQVLVDQLLADVRAIPGVESAAAMTFVPTGSGGAFRAGLGVERTAGEWTPLPEHARDQQVTDDFFKTLGVHLIAGRTFTTADTWGAPHVVVVSEGFARLGWPGQSAVGQYINENMGRDGRPGSTPELVQVVGVVANLRYELAAGDEPQIYYPRRQLDHPEIGLLVRSAPGSASVEQLVMNRLQSDGFRALGYLAPMVDAIRGSIVEPKFYALVLTLFAIVSVVLAGVGVYGVTGHLVSQRTREMGVRLALGARREQIGALILRAAGTLALIGVVAGLMGAASLTGFLRSLLFEVTPLDAASFAIAPVVVALTAFVAGLGPARRAGKIDPATLLRG